MKRILFAILSSLIVSPLVAVPQLAITHVTLIDGTGAPARPDVTVLITGDRITAVGSSNRVIVPATATTVDAAGKFLIPGLWDMHCHVVTRWQNAPLFIANGVIGVREMGSNRALPELAELRRQVLAGEQIGPRVVYAGPFVDGKDEYPGATRVVTNAAEARETVNALKAAGVDFIKVYDLLSRDSFYALAAEAKKRRVVFAGHVPQSVSAVEASDAGQKSFEHLTGLLEGCSTAGDEVRAGWAAVRADREKNGDSPALSDRSGQLWRKMLAGYDPAKCLALAHHLAANQTWQTPTLAEGLPFAMPIAGMADDPRLQYVPPKTADRWRKQLTAMSAEPPVRQLHEYEIRLDIVRTLHRAGVPLLAGTDAGSSMFINNVAGFSLHDELQLLVRAGLSPMEALLTATSNPAHYLGLSKMLGTVSEGKLADVVLLDADPIADISNTRAIRAVVVNGRFLGRTDLDAMLAGVMNDAKAR